MPSVHRWLHVALAVGLLAAAPAAQDLRELTPGASIRRELSTGQVHTYRLALARGDFVRVRIEQQGIDVAAALADPDGREVLAVDAMDDEFRPETVVAIAEGAGIHTLTIRPAPRAGAKGRYSIHLDPPRTASTRDELQVTAERAFAQGRKRRDVNQAATWPAALVDFNAARDGFQSLGDKAGELKALIEIAVTENYLARPEALKPAQEAERIAREIADRPAIARVLRVLASIYALAGDYDAAAFSAAHATEINQAIGNRIAESHSVNYTALLHSRMGDLDKAIALYERALALGRANGDRTLEASVLNNLAGAYLNLGEYEKSLAMYEQSLANQRAASNRRGEDIILMNLGGVHLKMGHLAKARELRFQALEIARRGGDSQTEARALAAVGQTYVAAGEYSEALRYYRDGLATSRRLGDVRNQAYALLAVGGALHRLGRDDEALETLQESLTIHRQTRQRLGERDTLADLARVERDRGNLDEALTYSRASVDLDEALREEITAPELRTTFVAAEQEKYELLIDVLQRRHHADPSRRDDSHALEVSERARARALLDSLLDARVDLREGIEPALRVRERSLQKQLNDAASDLSRLFGSKGRDEALGAAAQKVDRLTAEYQQLQAQIRRESPHYAAVTQPQPLSAREIQQSVLDEHTVLLEFALGEERSWLWAVTPDAVTSVELPSRGKIEAAARSLYERFTARQERRGEAPVAYTKRVAAADARLRPAMTAMSRMLFGGIARAVERRMARQAARHRRRRRARVPALRGASPARPHTRDRADRPARDRHDSIGVRAGHAAPRDTGSRTGQGDARDRRRSGVRPIRSAGRERSGAPAIVHRLLARWISGISRPCVTASPACRSRATRRRPSPRSPAHAMCSRRWISRPVARRCLAAACGAIASSTSRPMASSTAGVPRSPV